MADQVASAPPKADVGRVSLTLVLLRVFVCAAAFFAAAIAASVIGTFGLFRGLESEPVYSLAFWVSAGLGVLFIGTFALPVFAVIVIITEAFAVRNAFLFALCGGLIGAYFTVNEVSGLLSPTDRRLLIAVAAGLAGGWVYWALAGRKAGSYRERRYSVPSSSDSNAHHPDGATAHHPDGATAHHTNGATAHHTNGANAHHTNGANAHHTNGANAPGSPEVSEQNRP